MSDPVMHPDDECRPIGMPDAPVFSTYTSTPPCMQDQSFESSLPGAYEEDLLGQECCHRDNNSGDPKSNPYYMCEGVYELIADGSEHPHYGPKFCMKCNDTHHNCMRVKCNKCGNIERRYRWLQRMLMVMHVPNPRSTVMWTPLS